jgi:tRNA pseudouridine38-40 synthase
MRYALHLSYNGRHYTGWQKQAIALGVQGTIEKPLTAILRQEIELLGCGRTDTGVHAKSFVAHFDSETEPPENLVYRLNNMLPADIAIHSFAQVADDFHARFDAISRTYGYYIHFEKNPFIQDQSWWMPYKPEITAMEAAAHLLLGEREYKCFCKGEPANGNYVCNIINAHWEMNTEGMVFHITSNRFLRSMVRAIVGTMLKIGFQKMTLDEFKELLTTGKRSDAGNSVPPEGLFLEKVIYPAGSFNPSK